MEKKGSNRTSTVDTTSKSKKSSKVTAPKPKEKPKNGFWEKLIINSMLFIGLAAYCFFAATKTIEREETKPISYSDENQIAYRVYLKANDFYKEEYLGMNRAYVASLIDHIDIDYSYLFNIERLTKMDFNYRVIAQLILENNQGVSFVDEKYVIKDTTSDHIDNTNIYNINQHVVVDYGYYNYLANRFKNETGVDINGYLNVYLEVDKKTDEDLNYVINETTKSNIKIPLSERSLQINFDANNLEATKHVSPETIVTFNPEYLVIEIILFFIASIFLYRTICGITSFIKEKSAYDKYVDKLLKEYDRLIVETKTKIDLSKCHIADVKSFTELLDVRDNLKMPIMYYNTVEHQEGIFYIKNNTDVFRFVVKGIDLKK